MSPTDDLIAKLGETCTLLDNANARVKRLEAIAEELANEGTKMGRELGVDHGLSQRFAWIVHEYQQIKETP